MLEIIQFVLSGFWIWVGFALIFLPILGAVMNLIIHLYTIPFKFVNVRKHGYPPQYCDSIGNIKKSKQKTAIDNENN